MENQFLLHEGMLRKCLELAYLNGVKADRDGAVDEEEYSNRVIVGLVSFLYTGKGPGTISDYLKERIWELRKSIDRGAEKGSIDEILNREQQKEMEKLQQMLNHFEQ